MGPSNSSVSASLTCWSPKYLVASALFMAWLCEYTSEESFLIISRLTSSVKGLARVLNSLKPTSFVSSRSRLTAPRAKG